MPLSTVHVTLVGEDGNAFSIIGRVSKALKRDGQRQLAEEFQNDAMNCGSYDELLTTVMRYVEVD